MGPLPLPLPRNEMKEDMSAEFTSFQAPMNICSVCHAVNVHSKREKMRRFMHSAVSKAKNRQNHSASPPAAAAAAALAASSLASAAMISSNLADFTRMISSLGFWRVLLRDRGAQVQGVSAQLAARRGCTWRNGAVQGTYLASSLSWRASSMVLIFFSVARPRDLSISATVTRELMATPSADRCTSPCSCRMACEAQKQRGHGLGQGLDLEAAIGFRSRVAP